MRKRMRKIKGIKREIGSPEIYPGGQSEFALLGWGPTYGVMKETVDRLNQSGKSAQMIHYSQIFPFNHQHVAIEQFNKSKVIAVENNYTGHFSKATGLSIGQRTLKYDGRPFTSGEILDQIKDAR